MAIITIGSINIDHFYRVPRFVQPGETLLVDNHRAGLGGKGANQSIAAAHAGGAAVFHVGAVGADGGWTVDTIASYGVDTRQIYLGGTVTGHAIIQVNDEGENLILVHSGANQELELDQIERALSTRGPEDWLLLQNETNLTVESASLAKKAGLNVAYSAAPFIAEKALPMLPYVDLLCVNAIEAKELASHFGGHEETIPVPKLLVTFGAEGARYRDETETLMQPAFSVEAVDTTGAGDTFFGVFLASIAKGNSNTEALKIAAAAAALQVSKPGAADAIPSYEDVTQFLEAETTS